MNNILQLKGQLVHKKRDNNRGAAELPSSGEVDLKKIDKLIDDLIRIRAYWKTQPDLGGIILNADYIKIAAKSNRIQALFPKHGDPNEHIVGAKFINREGLLAHSITYFISIKDVEYAIELLSICKNVIKRLFNEVVTKEKLCQFNKTKYSDKDRGGLSKSSISQVIVDCFYVDKIYVEISPLSDYEAQDFQMVTLYKTNLSVKQLFDMFDVDSFPIQGFDDNTVLLNKSQFYSFYQKAPYLFAMAVDDIVKMSPLLSNPSTTSLIEIPSPTNEPVVGVIDTPFDGPSIYDEWVEKKICIDPEIEIEKNDYDHGTAVSTIIVNGPAFNPALEDGCGLFRVRHFGVAKATSFNSITVIRKIREIISKNTDIKVWNLSLGSILEISPNFISPEAAEIDKLQREFDIIFVIAGTNIPKNSNIKNMRIGAPADSINSLVVGSVGFDNKRASYSRKGPVLSFYRKPDVCYYGGDKDIKMNLCSALGLRTASGTSFAAPWITRKLAYLINVIGLSREVAKALIIDSALGWNGNPKDPDYIGYGVVPIHINEILYSKNDEIRFFINDVAKNFDTYNYNLPVPVDQGKCPYKAKATLCYFPNTSRNQGVDYTDTELDLHIGRLGPKGIKSINGNKQNEDTHVDESSARQLYRKWDNVKCICETITNRSRSIKVYDNPHWGFSIKKTERLNNPNNSLNFGLVVTLKEINGVNRIDSFIRDCYLNNWLVNVINVENRIDIYNVAEEEIQFD